MSSITHLKNGAPAPAVVSVTGYPFGEAWREQNGLLAVTIRGLLKTTSRHRPDGIIMGEIRGGEAFDLLQLLNTGHSGTLSTVHSNPANQGIARFTNCVQYSGVEMPYRAIRTNFADSLYIIIQIERRLGTRFVSGVLEIWKYASETGRDRLDPIWLRNEVSCTAAGSSI